MISALFLSAALACPVAMIPHHERHYDVSIFKFIVTHYKNYSNKEAPHGGRAYLIGGDDDLLFMLRQSGIESWRVTSQPHTPFDIVAYPNAIPLARESGLIVIYALYSCRKLRCPTAGL